MTKLATTLIPLLAVGIVLTACGGEDEPAATDAPEPTPTVAQTDAPEPTATPASSATPEAEPSVTAFGVGEFGRSIFTPDGERLLVTAPGKLLLYPADDIEAEPEVVTLPGDIVEVAFSPDGSLLAAGFADGDVHVLDATTFEPQMLLESAVGHYAGILDFSPDNTRLAVGQNIPSVTMAADAIVYDLASGEAAITIPGSVASDFLFSPDGSLLVGADTDTVVTSWDAATGEELGSVTLNEDPFQGRVDLLFNEDGSVLYASESEAGVFAIDPVSMDLTGPFADEFGSGANGRLALSPEEETLYKQSDRQLVLFDTTTQAASDAIEGLGNFNGYDLSPDGGSVAVLDTKLVESPSQRLDLWDVATKERLQTNTSSGLAVIQLDISPDGDEVAAGHADNKVRVWDISAAEPTLVDDYPDTYLGYFSEHASDVVVGVPRTLGAATVARRLREDGTDTTIGDVGFEPDIITISDGDPIMTRSMAYHSATDRVATEIGGVLSVVSGEDGEPLFTVDDAGEAQALIFSPDGSLLALIACRWCPSEDLLTIYAGDTGDVVQSLPIKDLGTAFDFSPDSQRFAIRSDDHIRVFDVGADEPSAVLNLGFGASEGALAFSGDGSDLAYSTDDAISFYDLTTGEFTMSIDTGERLLSMAFGPDDEFIVGGTDRGTLILVDLSD
jgi:WD40 repeat protein